MRAAALIAFASIAVIVAACARTETARFQAHKGQQALVRDGRAAIVSRQPTSLVIVSPASRQFRAGKRAVYVLAINNMSKAPLQFSVAEVWVGQVVGGQVARNLRVYRYEDLVQEERGRQVASAVLTGLAAVGNSYSAANAGYYNANATVYGPRGVSNVTISGYDPNAAALAQSQAAAQNEAMIANTIETGRRNLNFLEKSVIKDNTLFPGEWYGGQLHFDPPQGASEKSFIINLKVGTDVHQIEVTHNPD